MCSSSYSAWCSSCFLVFCCNSDVRFLCIEEVSPVRQPSSETRSCSSVQLFRGHHVRRTPRLQARGVFQCASVCGSQRTLLWQSGCDLCLAGSPTLGPCRHQGKSASVQAFNCFEVTAFGDPPAYDYLILLAFFFLILMLSMCMLSFKLMQLCCFRQADNHAVKLHLRRHRTTRSTKDVTSHESLQI